MCIWHEEFHIQSLLLNSHVVILVKLPQDVSSNILKENSFIKIPIFQCHIFD